MKKPVKIKIHFLFWLVFLWALAGCTNPFDRSTASEDADINGEITIYTPMGTDRTSPYLRVFQAKYPNIQVDLITLSASEILNRLRAEREES